MIRRFLIITMFILLLVGSVFYSLSIHPFFWPLKGESQKTLLFEVKPGESLSNVARRLAGQGVVTNGSYFVLFSRLTGKSKAIRVGEYDLHKGMSPIKVLSIISSGRSHRYSITIPEGTNMYELAETMAKQGLGTRSSNLALMKNPSFIHEALGKRVETLEGYLFPETYFYTRYTEPKTLLLKMVSRFKEAFSYLEIPKNFPLNQHEIVTLASIIEKETGAPQERRRISSVFHNRLRKNMRLQTDPTVIYGVLDKTQRLVKNITRKHLKKKNRYNTYTFRGLPWGPISNPGKKALAATLDPEKSPYLYFVSRNDGTHVFSKNYRQHSRAVRKFQLDPRMRRGKSWRDLKSKRSSSQQ